MNSIDCGKTEEIKIFSSIDRYQMEMTLQEGEDKEGIKFYLLIFSC
jgi:hypothetical protein